MSKAYLYAVPMRDLLNEKEKKIKEKKISSSPCVKSIGLKYSQRSKSDNKGVEQSTQIC